MNIIKFLDEFTNESLLEKKSSRRDAFSTLSSFGKKAALAAVPFGLAGASNKAFAMQSSGDPTSALQLALTLEYLEAEFYTLGTGIVEELGDARSIEVYKIITRHENSHVAFLEGALETNAEESKPQFDFTVGGMFDPFNQDSNVPPETSYAQFLAISQALEDTGVRAYKGQAGNLISAPDLLTFALQIHSVEARHASEVRRLRGLKGWITGSERGAGMPEATQSTYNGEENTSHLGVDNVQFAPSGAGAPAVTEAYDEPLTGEQATAIASVFIAS